MSGISGWPSNKKTDLGTGKTSNFVTVYPTDPYRNALDAPRFAFRVNDEVTPRTAGVATGIDPADNLFWIADTATPAKVGDFVRFQNGNAQFIEMPIAKVETNRFLISTIPDSDKAPASGNTFFIMRYTTQRVDDTGSQVVTVTSGPIQYVYNGIDTEVTQDDATPANSRPMPVLAASVVNTGVVQNISNLVATAQTFTAPAGAIGFKIQTPSTNTENVAFTIGATATISTGILMEPGRSEDFDTGSNISVIATSATTQRVTVLWKVRP